MKKPKITIKDIARELNISKSTVSRALSNSRDINPETKQKIIKYAEQAEFKPDFHAKSLRNRKTKTIGVIVPAYNIPFYSLAICGIQDYSMKHGYNVIVCHSNEKYAIEVKNIEALIEASVDGIIISIARDTNNFKHIMRLKHKGIPFVMFNRVPENFKAAKVLVDDYYGAYNMVKYLITTGCRRIAHISGPLNLMLSLNRRAGYMDALAASGINIDNEIIKEGDFTSSSGISCMREIFESEKYIDALFCVCDAVAFGAMKVIKEYGRRIPEDISVAGFTNEPMAELVEPSLTTVNQPVYEIGESTCRLLFAQFEDPDLPAELCVLKTEIVERNSTLKLKEHQNLS